MTFKKMDRPDDMKIIWNHPPKGQKESMGMQSKESIDDILRSIPAAERSTGRDEQKDVLP